MATAMKILSRIVPVLVVSTAGGVKVQQHSHCKGSSNSVGRSQIASSSLETVLLQQSARMRSADEMVADGQMLRERSSEDESASIEWSPSKGRHLPLCHERIVRQACRRMNGAPEGSSPSNISYSLLQDQLSADSDSMEKMWRALELPAGQAAVGCEALCSSVIKYVNAIGAQLPPSSDVACYSVEGTNQCAEADPYILAQMLGAVQDDPLPDQGAQMAPEDGGEEVRSEEGPHLMQVSTSSDMSVAGGLRRSSRRTNSSVDLATPPLAAAASAPLSACPYSNWEIVERIASIFRMYPSDGRDLRISMPAPALIQGAWADRAPNEVATRIAASTAQARAWVSAVLGEMEEQQTGELRTKWFGGTGAPSDADVRSRVMRTMNFIARELLDGVHYVYPADEAQDTSCGGTTVAYVWKFRTGASGYVETRGPVCEEGQSPFSKACGMDREGRYFVYLCKRWFDDIGENSQISTLVHEAAHHAGPGDVTYSKTQMQQLARTSQLDNAANYQYFAQDVAQSAWGCADSEDVNVGNLRCTPSPCQCPSFSSLCDDSRYGSEVRQKCPATCGDCTAPAPTTAVPTTSTSPTTSLQGFYPTTTIAPLPTDPPTSRRTTQGPTPAPITFAETTPAPETAVQTTTEWPATAAPTPLPTWAAPATSTTKTRAPTAMPTPAPSTSIERTPAPTPTPMWVPSPPVPSPQCSESESEKRIRVGFWRYTGSCDWFKQRGWCSKEDVVSACPITCGKCISPGCADDPEYSMPTTLGDFTCRTWRHYNCWKEVEEFCPTACRVERCTR